MLKRRKTISTESELNTVEKIDIKPGDVIQGEVTNLTKFGAFVKLANGEEGLIHISEIANEYVTDITQFVAKGDTVQVKVLVRNNKGKLDLSLRKASEDHKDDPADFLIRRSKDEDFESKLTGFLKKSEEKQIDIRRNLKYKQGVKKKK